VIGWFSQKQLVQLTFGAARDTMAFLELRGVEKLFGNLRAIKGVNCRSKRRVHRLRRPSGCAVDAAAHDRRPHRDRQRQPAPRRPRHHQARPSKRDLAMVFQSYALYPHMSVAEHVVRVAPANVDKAVIQEKARAAAIRT
jgi:multiple sugar transport system ATP-binding protein